MATLLSVIPGPGNTISLVFDAPTGAGTPTIGPDVNGLGVLQVNQIGVNEIQLEVTFPTVTSTTLISIVASNGLITLTFNKAVALSSAGQQASSYVITTVTPGAVIPTITSVEVGGSQVVLHTTEQTTGADYTVTVAPGSIYGTN